MRLRAHQSTKSSSQRSLLLYLLLNSAIVNFISSVADGRFYHKLSKLRLSCSNVPFKMRLKTANCILGDKFSSIKKRIFTTDLATPVLVGLLWLLSVLQLAMVQQLTILDNAPPATSPTATYKHPSRRDCANNR